MQPTLTETEPITITKPEKFSAKQSEISKEEFINMMKKVGFTYLLNYNNGFFFSRRSEYDCYIASNDWRELDELIKGNFGIHFEGHLSYVEKIN